MDRFSNMRRGKMGDVGSIDLPQNFNISLVMLFDNILVLQGVTLHQLTYLLKVYLACIRVRSHKTITPGFVTGLLLVILYGHGGSLIVSIILGKPFTFLVNDFQFMCNFLFWAGFYYFENVADSLSSFMKNRVGFTLIHVGNETRRALSLAESVKVASKENFIDLYAFFTSGLSLTAGGILWPFWCWILFNENKRCTELYELNWRTLIIFVNALVMQLSNGTSFETYVIVSICMFNVSIQLNDFNRDR
jgi:hypothetical protein